MGLDGTDDKDASLNKLFELVNNISKILRDNGIAAKIDFDHRDGLIIVKYQAQMGSGETTCIIDNKNKLVSGIDVSKLWMPDYSAAQKVDRKILAFLEAKGYRANY